MKMEQESSFTPETEDQEIPATEARVFKAAELLLGDGYNHLGLPDEKRQKKVKELEEKLAMRDFSEEIVNQAVVIENIRLELESFCEEVMNDRAEFKGINDLDLSEVESLLTNDEDRRIKLDHLRVHLYGELDILKKLIRDEENLYVGLEGKSTAEYSSRMKDYHRRNKKAIEIAARENEVIRKIGDKIIGQELNQLVRGDKKADSKILEARVKLKREKTHVDGQNDNGGIAAESEVNGYSLKKTDAKLHSGKLQPLSPTKFEFSEVVREFAPAPKLGPLERE